MFQIHSDVTIPLRMLQINDDCTSTHRHPLLWYTYFWNLASRTALGSIQPPNQWVPGDLSLWIKRSVNLVPRSKNAWSYTFIPSIRLHGVLLSWKQGDIFTFF